MERVSDAQCGEECIERPMSGLVRGRTLGTRQTPRRTRIQRDVDDLGKRVIDRNLKSLRGCDDRIGTHLLSHRMFRMGMSLVIVLQCALRGEGNRAHHGRTERPQDLTQEDRHNHGHRESLEDSRRQHSISISSFRSNGKGNMTDHLPAQGRAEAPLGS